MENVMSSVIEPHVQLVITRSISALASVCDHAQARDSVGFSKATAGPGHEIAALGLQRWTPEIWNYAGRLSAHHSKQLEAARVIDERDVGELLLFANSGVKSPPIKSDWIDTAEIDGREMLVISIRSHQELVSILKRARDVSKDDVYQPAGSGKLWRVSDRFAFAIGPFASEFENLSEKAAAFIDRSRDRASKSDMMLAHNGPVIVLNDKKTALRFVYRFSQELKQALYDTDGGTWWKKEDWNSVQFTISLNEKGHTLFERLCRDHNAIADEEARAAIFAVKNVPAPKVSDSVSFDFVEENNRLILRTPSYIPAWVDVFRTIPGRKYENGNWNIPAISTCVEELVKKTRIIDGMEKVAEKAIEMLAMLKAREASDPTATRAKDALFPKVSIDVSADGKLASISMSKYDGGWVSVIKGLPKKSRSWTGSSWDVKNDRETFAFLAEGFASLAGQRYYAAYGAAAAESVCRHLDMFDHELATLPGLR
jgi:hypothetical protein